MTVEEMLERMSSRELTEWRAYWEIEPWGEERADLRVGTLSAIVANVARGKGQRPFSPADFFYRPAAASRPRGPLSDEELLAKARVIHEQLVAHFKGQEKPAAPAR